MERRAGHILIVDDDPQILGLFQKILTQGGYTVTAVSSGESAIEILDKTRFDLLVLDLSMPEPDGFDVLKLLRASHPGLRILVISGFMQGALLKASEILGATASLSKTEAPGMLLKTVDSLLRSGRIESCA